MQTKEQILALAKNMESDCIERTRSTSDTDKFGQAICAMSNDLYNRKQNGFLLLGVDDKTGELTGLQITDRLLQNIGAIRSDGNVLP
jgi:ATP-dependent DNA helicase RecG